MFLKLNMLAMGVAVIVAVVASPAWATWVDCPGVYAGADCDPDAYDVCAVNAGKIECDLTDHDDEIYLVTQDGNLWAYGTVHIGEGSQEYFCCDAAELGTSVVEAEIDTRGNDDIVCLHDSDLSVNSVTICEDISGAGVQYWPEEVVVEGRDGIDLISTSPVGVHDDTVNTGDGGGYVLTWGGADTINGGAGVDYLYGGDHNDTIDGGAEDDYLYGDSGIDTIDGGDGADVIHGGSGDDVIMGDCDSCTVDYGGDTIYGDDGADQIKGWYGDDVVYGGDGDDQICGGDGTDSLYGNDDDDCICGGRFDAGYNCDGDPDTMDGNLGSDDAYWCDGTDSTDHCTAHYSASCSCDCEP